MTISNRSSKASKPMVTKLHLESPGVEETKICSNRPGHMTNTVTMPVYDKSLKIFFSRTNKPIALKLCMTLWVLEDYKDS